MPMCQRSQSEQGSAFAGKARGRGGYLPGRGPVGRSRARRDRRCGRGSCAGRRAGWRARRPWPLRASRHWARHAGRHRATSPGAPPGRDHPGLRRPQTDPGEARGGQVQQIVEAGRGPAEMPVALGSVADHAVGGIDRLVDDDARQAEQRKPQGRRHHGVGGVLGQTLDGAAGDAGAVEPGGSRPTMWLTAARPRSGSSSPSATAATARARSRWARNGTASALRRRSRRGMRATPGQRHGDGQDQPEREPRASAPRIRPAACVRTGRLRVRSSQPISAPSHSTGWPMRRESADG
jgi:hypothetical protein